MSSITHKEEYKNFVTKFRSLKPVDFLNEDDILSDEQCSKAETEKNIKKVYKLINDLNEANNELNNEKTKIANLLNELSPDLDKLKEFKNVNYLLEFLDKIKHQHQNLEKLFQKSKKSNKIIDNDQNVLNAIQIYDEMLNNLTFLTDLQPSSELNQYLKQILFFWNDYLIKKVDPIFNQCMKAIKWPAITLLNEERNPLLQKTEALEKFKKFFEAYLKLDETKELKKSLDESTKIKTESTKLDLIKNDGSNQFDQIEISLPVEKLVLPLKKRFIYYFQQEIKTNHPEKPEWYLNQIISWIKNHEVFLEQITNPIFRRISKNRAHSTKLQFIYVLVSLAKRKITLDLTQLVYDDTLFAHLFDETLIFTNELKNYLEEGEFEIYSELNLIDVFAIEPYFSKLINLKNREITKFIENRLNSENAWSYISDSYTDESLDDFKIPNCTDEFILRLMSITKLISSFNKLESKSNFVKLQLDCIDDFRLRLAQLTNNPIHEEKDKPPSVYFAILNSLHYLIFVLEEWKYQPLFMEVSEYLLIDSVFDEILELLNHLLNEMIQKIINGFVNQLRIKIHRYTKIKWFCLDEDQDQELACASYELSSFLTSTLNMFKKKISGNLFEKLIRIIIVNLNSYFVNDFIMECTFNDYAVRMLNQNININLIPIFKIFFNMSDDKFIEILDCCKLLSLDKETNDQFKKVFNESSLEEYIDLLNEYKINSLEPDLTIKILNRKLFL